ncbi:MAG: 4Fe-4S binding protein [Methanomicrobiales archaeon]|nr:4Fe-4S binding protein [Methanomicrobiales archaeon]
MVPFLAHLWYRGCFRLWTGIVVLALTVLIGFLSFAPRVPYQFQLLFVGWQSAGPGGPALVVVAGIIALLALTLLFGRFFCGYLFPIGALFELASRIPGPKVPIPWPRIPLIIRMGVFLLIVVAGVTFSIGVLNPFGIGEFFSLTASVFSFVFVVLILASIFVYRPFCRFVCPIGALAFGSRVFQSLQDPVDHLPVSSAESVRGPVRPARQAGRTGKESATSADGV